ncbi:GMC oxidoreductase [Mucilaginibacter gilvus]|uniref:GMC family oxidoreductase n=1 Tax=Mucilaginibacter gilvus TaxID=2305909 RepID=A0A3S3VDQ5_9SPHI|nr:GMC family oxidoreductase [Mucilaginibacter gilvus]RWY51223.1 GMC family oxidoreductase [Mucilaginibacter gilvus]
MKTYDLIIIGTGAGGGTLVHKLKDTGKSILVLERGGYLPREKANWDSKAVFQDERYHTKEVWKTKNGEDLHPGTGYWVGGNTKVYGAALFRLRERDFKELQHEAGVSPAWPLTYADYEPYYTEAEKLYWVHGKMGMDPTEPFRTEEYAYPPVSHEPRIQELHDALVENGSQPFYMPMAIKLTETDMLNSPCIRCNTCDGYPCMIHAKSDADINCVRPALENDNITLMIDAKAERLVTTADGTSVDYIEVTINGELVRFKAPIVVVACGAINSAALLLKSANEQHLNGLANGSGQLGRNFMKHNSAAMLGISLKKNPTQFQKTLACNDYYFGDPDFPYPMGHVQLLGKSDKAQLKPNAPFFAPGIVLEEMAEHAIDWWFTGEDLPDTNNRVQVIDGQIHLDYTENNKKSFDRLVDTWKTVLANIDTGHSLIPQEVYLSQDIPLAGVGHQAGTARFGTDPKTSVLDTNCKAHEIDNLYVVDGSFFPSIGAVNPSLTIIANALRVGDHLIEKLHGK